MITTADHLKTLAQLDGAGERAIVLLDDDRGGPSRPPVQGWRELPRGSGELPELEPDQPAVLVYTSGTTGTPKGVPLTHANLCANLDALVAERLASPGDRVLLPLPLQHVYPLTVGLLAPLASGAAVVLPAGITGPQISEALQECACTIMIAVPRLYEAMLAGIERKMDALGSIALGSYRRLLAFSTWLFRRFGWRAGRLLFCPAASPGRSCASPARLGRRAAQARDRMAAQRPRLGGPGGLRPERDLADPDLQPEGPRPGRLRGAAGQGHRASDRAGAGCRARHRRDPGARPQRVRRLLAQRGGHQGELHRRRLLPAPATSAASTTTAICSSSAAARR